MKSEMARNEIIDNKMRGDKTTQQVLGEMK